MPNPNPLAIGVLVIIQCVAIYLCFRAMKWRTEKEQKAVDDLLDARRALLHLAEYGQPILRPQGGICDVCVRQRLALEKVKPELDKARDQRRDRKQKGYLQP